MRVFATVLGSAIVQESIKRGKKCWPGAECRQVFTDRNVLSFGCLSCLFPQLEKYGKSQVAAPQPLASVAGNLALPPAR